MTKLADRIRTGRLSGGAEVYLIESHRNQTVDLVGVIDGGMFLEPPALAGVANLCISTLDRGTQRRSQAEISDALESNGARMVHGLTREAVAVRGRCLAEDFELLLELLGDTLAHPAFPDAEVELAREEARAGLREAAFDTFTQAYHRAAAHVLGEDHPYARDALGRRDTLEAVTRADMEAYRRSAIAAARLKLAIVGDIDCDRTLALLEEALAEIPAGAATLPAGTDPTDPGAGASERSSVGAPPPAAPPNRGRVRDHVEIADKGQTDIVLVRPGVARTREDFTAYGLANFVLGGSFVSRLNQSLRDRQGLTYAVQSTLVSGRCPGLWSAYVGVHPQDVERAIAGATAEMEALAREGATEEELELARMHLTGSFPIKLETNRAVAATLLEGIRLGKGIDYIDSYRDRILAVTAEEVRAAAADLLQTGDLAIVTSGTLNTPTESRSP